MMKKPLSFAAIGLDHRHIYGQSENMQSVGFDKRFPGVPRVKSRQEILDDETIDLVLIAAVPADRAKLAIEAMEHGKDVMVDKPGCTSIEQLDAIKECVARTGRIWSIDFSERFEVASVTKAAELVQAGAIGKVVQTVGQKERYGGILCDIASHQVDQFLYFTGSTDATVSMASVGNYANPNDKGLQDFGEIALRSESAHGYIRVDWYTPDALPTWGDGRLTILGTEGTIELRKYVDIARSDNTDHLYLVNGSQCEHIDCREAGYPYFEQLADDIRNRTENAMPQSHCFKVMELALQAQTMADAQSSGAVA